MQPSSPVPLQDVLMAAQDAYSGLRLSLEDPTDAELQEGIRRFSYSQEDWTIHGKARLDKRGATLLSLEVEPSAAASGGVTATMVRGLPIGKITASLRTLMTLDQARRDGILGEGATASTTLTVSYGAMIPGLGTDLTATVIPAPPATPARRGGKAPVTAELLRAVAEAYLEETAEGQPPRPLSRMAARFDKPEETVRTWLSRARKEGWLAAGIQGRAGGEPGPLLLAARLAGEAK